MWATWTSMLAGRGRGAIDHVVYLIECRLSHRRRLGELFARRNARRWERYQAVRPGPFEPAEQSWFSQHGEDGVLLALLERVPEAPQTFVEIGSGDGSENCTRVLVEQGWSGTWMEGDPDRAARAAQLQVSGSLTIKAGYVTTANLADLLASTTPEVLGVAVVDIDGNDFWVLDRLLAERSPVVVVVEYNAAFPPGSYWRRRNRPLTAWDQTYRHGASLDALDEVAVRHGYGLVACDSSGVNAFFVHRSMLDRLPEAGRPRDHYRPPRFNPLGFGHPRTNLPVQRPIGAADRRRITIEAVELRPDGGGVRLEATVVNGSDQPLQSRGDHAINVGVAWCAGPALVDFEHAPVVPLPGVIPPGARRRLLGWIPDAPANVDAAVVTLVQGGVAWWTDDGPEASHARITWPTAAEATPVSGPLAG